MLLILAEAPSLLKSSKVLTPIDSFAYAFSDDVCECVEIWNLLWKETLWLNVQVLAHCLSVVSQTCVSSKYFPVLH